MPVAMTRDQAVAAIKRRLGFYQKKDEEIVDELTISQGRLERGLKLPIGTGIFMPWFLVTEIQNAVTVIGEDRVAVPQAIPNVHSGFLQEVEDAALWVIDPDAEEDDPWTELDKLDFDTMQEKHAGDGIPKAYCLMGQYFRLRPFPDKAYPLKIISFNGDVVPTAGNQTNKWLTFAPEVLWGHAGLQIAGALRDGPAVQQFQQAYSEGILALFTTGELRKNANKRSTMGGED